MRNCNRLTAFISLSTVILLIVGSMFLTHCKKFEVSQVVIVKTEGVSEITMRSCKVAGTLVDVGSSGVNNHGFCRSLTTNPAEAIDCNQLGSEDERVSFSSVIEDLAPETKYYFWAYASLEGIRTYGDRGEFTTLPAQFPEVETGTVSEITSTSAKCGYSILSDGGSPVSMRGLCWGREPLPSLENAENHTEDGDSIGNYTGTMTGLTPEADYFVRAYATNGEGTAYGDQKTFGTPPNPMQPEVETNSPQELTEHSVVLGGSILQEGYAEITAKGIYWGLAPNPTENDNILHGGSGASAFQLTLGDLSSSTTYYYRAFAENSAGIGLGEPLKFKTLFECGDPLIDERDGQEYPTVLIGEQCWMAKNLNVGLRVDIETGQTADGIQKFCYEDNPSHCLDYGGLYTWDEMMQNSTDQSAQGVCPDGWHIPSDGEWMALEKHLGILETDLETEAYRGYNQGGMLKSADKPPWAEPNTLATNSTQFSALPSGMIFPVSSTSSGLGSYTVYWVSSPVDEATAIYRMLHTDEGGIGRYAGARPNTTSVRCVRD